MRCGENFGVAGKTAADFGINSIETSIVNIVLEGASVIKRLG